MIKKHQKVWSNNITGWWFQRFFLLSPLDGLKPPTRSFLDFLHGNSSHEIYQNIWQGYGFPQPFQPHPRRCLCHLPCSWHLPPNGGRQHLRELQARDLAGFVVVSKFQTVDVLVFLLVVPIRQPRDWCAWWREWQRRTGFVAGLEWWMIAVSYGCRSVYGNAMWQLQKCVISHQNSVSVQVNSGFRIADERPTDLIVQFSEPSNGLAP